MDICSLWAYADIKNSGYLGERQALVLSIFSESPHCQFTASQIVSQIGRGKSENTRNRITELDKKGFLKKTDKIKCEFSGKMVNRWKYTGRTTPLTPGEQNQTTKLCGACLGKGRIPADKLF